MAEDDSIASNTDGHHANTLSAMYTSNEIFEQIAQEQLMFQSATECGM